MSLNRFLLWITVAYCVAATAKAQDDTNLSIGFVNELITKNRAADALIFLKYDSILSSDQNAFLSLKCHYAQRDFQKLDSVFQNSLFHEKDLEDKARIIWNQGRLRRQLGVQLIQDSTAPFHDISRLQKLGEYLLNHQKDSLKNHMGEVDHDNVAYQNIVFNFYLKSVNKKLHKKNKKSWLAASMSAIIPGSGRLYAGKWTECITSLWPILVFSAQAGEGYYYLKEKSPHLYVFAPIALVFYSANVYGSAKAAKRKNNERKLILENEVFSQLDPIILGL